MHRPDSLRRLLQILLPSDISSGWRYKDRLGIVKGGLKIVFLPVVFLGIGVAGLMPIELMYACG